MGSWPRAAAGDERDQAGPRQIGAGHVAGVERGAQPAAGSQHQAGDRVVDQLIRIGDDVARARHRRLLPGRSRFLPRKAPAVPRRGLRRPDRRPPGRRRQRGPHRARARSSRARVWRSALRCVRHPLGQRPARRRPHPRHPPPGSGRPAPCDRPVWRHRAPRSRRQPPERPPRRRHRSLATRAAGRCPRSVPSCRPTPATACEAASNRSDREQRRHQATASPGERLGRGRPRSRRHRRPRRAGHSGSRSRSLYRRRAAADPARSVGWPWSDAAQRVGHVRAGT